MWGRLYATHAILLKLKRNLSCHTVPQTGIIKHISGIAIAGARPMPIDEGILKRFLSPIGIDIGMTGPTNRRTLHGHLNPRTRRDRLPLM